VEALRDDNEVVVALFQPVTAGPRTEEDDLLSVKLLSKPAGEVINEGI
jgi:hypothetical protein